MYLLIVPHALGIPIANSTYGIVSLDYVNESQVNTCVIQYDIGGFGAKIFSLGRHYYSGATAKHSLDDSSNGCRMPAACNSVTLLHTVVWKISC